MDADYCIAVVPSPTKSRVFTLDDISAATQNFSQKIGRGGFGWVFFGQLPEGKEIAVKVLSLFSTQGVNQFLNEVILIFINIQFGFIKKFIVLINCFLFFILMEIILCTPIFK